MRSPVNRHRIWQLAADGVLIAAAWYLAFQLRFDPGRSRRFYETLFNWRTICSSSSIKLAVFIAFGFYNRWWRYVSTRDMWGAARGVTVACARREPRRLLLPAPGHRVACRAGSRSSTGCSCSPSSPARACSRARSSSGPAAAGLVARGKEVIVVGAGDAGQLIIKEMLKRGRARVHADRHRRRRPAQEEPAPPRRARARDDRRAAAHPPRQPAGRAADRDSRPRRATCARRSSSIARDAQVPVKTLPGLYELISGDTNLAAPDPAGAGRGHPRARAGRRRLRVDRRQYLARRDGARHRRRRLDRLRALPPGRRGRARRG